MVETVVATGADVGEAGEAANRAEVASESEELNMERPQLCPNMLALRLEVNLFL
jgi:hypothetical protein